MSLPLPASTAEALSAVAAARASARAAEVALIVGVARLCELYRVDDAAAWEGMERLLHPGHDGTPGVGEFLALELGPILGVPPGVALQKVSEVLDVRYRFPLLWETFLDGGLEWWQVASVARRAVELSVEKAAWLDRQLACAMRVMPWARIARHLDAWIVQADPGRAAERAAAARRERRVGIDKIRDGACQLWGQLDARDGIDFDHTLTRIAEALPDDEGTLEQRRATAVGILARRCWGQEVLPAATVVVHINADDPALYAGIQQNSADSGAPQPTQGSASGVGGATPAPVCNADSGRDVASLDSAVPGAWVSQASSSPPVASGVAAVEKWGVFLTARLPEFLAGSKVTVHPVIDPWAIAPHHRHDPGAALRLAVEACMPVEAFPYGTRASRYCDLDHTIPWRPDQPDSTRWGNLAPLARRSHRAKTFGGWELAQPAPGVFHWRSPAGYEYAVTPAGTTGVTVPPPRRSNTFPTEEPLDPPPPPDERPIESEAWSIAQHPLTNC